MHEKRVKEHVREKTDVLCRICDKLEEWVECEIAKGSENANAVGLGMVTDMLKDVCEAKEKVVKACYYEELMGEMEEDSEFEKEERERRKQDRYMYFPVQGSNSGSAAERGFPGPYNPLPMMAGQMRWQDGATWSERPDDKRGEMDRRRKGFSFDSYMEAMEMYPSDDQDSKRMRIESLNKDLDDLVNMGKDVVARLSPEEKQVWKGKISKLLNA